MSEDTKTAVFSITEDMLETGLRGFPVGYCTTSFVDPIKGLHYRGLPIDTLYGKSPEEIIYLIFYGTLPLKEELALFSSELQKRSEVGADFFQRLQGFPPKSPPMKVFASALLLLGSMYGTGDWKEDALNVIAKIPIVTGGVLRYTQGKKPDVRWNLQEASKNPTWIGRLIESLGPELIIDFKKKDLSEILRLFMVLHMDHGGGNLSTFVGKAIASGLEDIYGSLAGAMLALEGPRHGRANQDCLDFLEKLIQEHGTELSPEKLSQILRDLIKKGELIYGYGHAVLRIEDARATVLYNLAKTKHPDHPLIKIALLLRQVAPSILSENPKISDPYPNVDAISGPLLVAAGFSYTEAIPVLFGCSRIIGITRQIMYERLEARSGKGTPIVRPKYLYISEGSKNNPRSG